MCATAGQDRAKGHANEDQIKQDAARACIGQIHFDHLFETDVSAARHLPDTGDPGLDAQAAKGVLGVCIDLRRQGRARADNGHLSAQYVQDLRQFVDGRAADKAPDAGDARVGLGFETNALSI